MHLTVKRANEKRLLGMHEATLDQAEPIVEMWVPHADSIVARTAD